MHILLLFLVLLPLTSSADSESNYVKELAHRLVPFYEKLHQNPELSFKEEKTSKIFADELKSQGFEVTYPFGGFGVVGVLKNGNGPTVLLRTDLDALPLTEETKLPYASTVKTKTKDGNEVGAMHACGHDLHITNMAGVAAYLQQHKNRWKGTVIIIGQPAEEKGGGAKALINAGLLKKFPRPNYALALHVDGSTLVGTATLFSGTVTANVDSVDIKMVGRGGHGARPQDAIDPIPMASELVLSLQTLISREKDPTESAVVTVGSFHAGTKHNIIPDFATLQLTIRTFSEKTRTLILDGLKRKAKAIAMAYRAPEPEITFAEDPVPSVINSSQVVDKIRPTFEKVLGKDNVLTAQPWTVGEDFSLYGNAGIPSVLFSLGTISKSRMDKYSKKGHIPGLHSSAYFPSAEESLRVGIYLMGESAISLLN